MQEAGFESLLLTVCVTLDKSPQPLKLNKKELPILDLQRSGQSHTHLCAQHACHNIQHIFITQQIFRHVGLIQENPAKFPANIQCQIFFNLISELIPCLTLPEQKNISLSAVSFFFWPCRVSHGILVPQPRVKPTSPTLGALDHWSTREVPRIP